MKSKPYFRPVVITAISLTVFFLFAALLSVTRSVGMTYADDSSVRRDTTGPRSPAAVLRAVLPRSTAAYNGADTSAQTLYVPWLLARTSVIRVYNSGNAPATVHATLSNGATADPINLAPGAVGDIEPTGVPTGTVVSAILSSNQPIAAVVNDFGVEGKQATSYTAMEPGLGRNLLALPDIFSETGGGWNSEIAVQNVGALPARVTIVYTRTVDPLPTNWTDSVPALQPGMVHVFEPGQAGLPENYVGIATVHADQPIVAIVRNAAIELGSLTPRQAFIYREPMPMPTGGAQDALFYPVLANAFEDWSNSEIQFMNASSTQARFALELYGEDPVSIDIPPWGAYNDPQSDDGRGSDWVGAGSAPDASSVHSLVWFRGSFEGDSVAAYTTPAAGATTWYMPYADQDVLLSTYVAVQNPNNSTVNITMTLHNISGTASTYLDIIEPTTVTLYTGGEGMPPGFVGGAVLKTDKPVAVVALIAGRLLLDKETYLPVLSKQ